MMKKRLLIITALFSVSVAQNIWWVDLKNGNNFDKVEINMSTKRGHVGETK